MHPKIELEILTETDFIQRLLEGYIMNKLFLPGGINNHVTSWEKENHRSKYLAWGYVSSQEGSQVDFFRVFVVQSQIP